MKKLKQGYNYLQKTGLFYMVLLIIFSSIVFSSCNPPKNAYYFKNLPRDTSLVSVNRVAESRIRKSDLLAINISSLNRDEDATYNSASIGSSGYLVDAQGNIQLHKLGSIHVEGMTRAELKTKIQKDIEPYLKDPVVTVRYLNHRVSVLGEVAHPAQVQMPEERLSILEVLSASGDVTGFAQRNNILIIRETANGKDFKRINLEDHSIFTSEWYWLQPDDVVYVEPNDKKLKDEKRNKAQQTFSWILSGVSLAIIILDRVTR